MVFAAPALGYRCAPLLARISLRVGQITLLVAGLDLLLLRLIRP